MERGFQNSLGKVGLVVIAGNRRPVWDMQIEMGLDFGNSFPVVGCIAEMQVGCTVELLVRYTVELLLDCNVELLVYCCLERLH